MTNNYKNCDVVITEKNGMVGYATMVLKDNTIYSIEPFAEHVEGRHYYNRYGTPKIAEEYMQEVEKIQPMYEETNQEDEEAYVLLYENYRGLVY